MLPQDVVKVRTGWMRVTLALACASASALHAERVVAQSSSGEAPASPRPGEISAASTRLPERSAKSTQPREPRDGRHDFDFEIGTWKTHLRRLVRPLTGSKEWVEYEGTTTVRKVWDGRANLVELDVTGPAGRLQGLSLRLYNPDARQWSLNFANIGSGTLSIPSIGEFTGGRGEFLSHESLDGRAILVRFVITPVTADSCRFEQAFSDDGGRSWEINWIATDVRVMSPMAPRSP